MNSGQIVTFLLNLQVLALKRNSLIDHLNIQFSYKKLNSHITLWQVLTQSSWNYTSWYITKRATLRILHKSLENMQTFVISAEY